MFSTKIFNFLKLSFSNDNYPWFKEYAPNINRHQRCGTIVTPYSHVCVSVRLCGVQFTRGKEKKGVRVCDFLFGACSSLTERKRFAVCRLFFLFFCVCDCRHWERKRERDQWLRGNNGREKERYPLCAGKSRREQKKSLVQTSGCFQRTSQLYYYHSLLKKQKQMAWAAACVRVGKHSSPSLLPLYSNQNSMPLLKPPLLFSPHL